jgi:hypothetical protein
MRKQPAKKPIRMAPLQRLNVKPIEDPVEQAALDQRLRQAEKKLRQPGSRFLRPSE